MTRSSCVEEKFETPNRSQSGVLAQLSERPPDSTKPLSRAHRPVDEVEVDVVQAEPAEACAERRDRICAVVVLARVEVLRRDVDVLAELPDGLPNLRLVTVSGDRSVI
jgi:hypothetical protein